MELHLALSLIISLCSLTTVIARHNKAIEVLSFGAIELGFMSHIPGLHKRKDLPEAYEEVLKSLNEASKGCNASERYRRANGLCNNLENPTFGAVLSVQDRLLPNAYSDKKGLPRLDGDQGHLPNAREVSEKTVLPSEENGDFLDQTTSRMSWQWGQYLDHDLTLTEAPEVFNCCKNENKHQYSTGGPCFPILIDHKDKHFHEDCLEFRRSFSVKVGDVREQISGITSFVDASNVYGSSQTHQNNLRSHVGGKMKMGDRRTLPLQGESFCRKELVGAKHCSEAGDIRVNENPGLTIIHQIFVREHNRLAEKLASINPHWHDERIFQETRKIVIALHQKITYEDFLPLVIGPLAMKKLDLEPGSYSYDKDANPNIINSFSTAAFRFGHAMVNSNQFVQGKSTPLSQLFFQPWLATRTEKEMKATILGQCKKPSVKCGAFMSPELTKRLFLDIEGPGKSADLAALNVQRGRDHGLPPFKKYQELSLRQLGLTDWPLKEFPDPHVYGSPEDIDLFVGGLFEKPLDNAFVGPTFAYIIGEQFRRIKFGDRFFYESPDPVYGFRPDQQREIRRMSLSHTLCHTMETKEIQRSIFHIPSPSNPLVPCDQYIDINLDLWHDCE